MIHSFHPVEGIQITPDQELGPIRRHVHYPHIAIGVTLQVVGRWIKAVSPARRITGTTPWQAGT